jgi:hypothetical protein
LSLALVLHHLKRIAEIQLRAVVILLARATLGDLIQCAGEPVDLVCPLRLETRVIFALGDFARKPRVGKDPPEHGSCEPNDDREAREETYDERDDHRPPAGAHICYSCLVSSRAFDVLQPGDLVGVRVERIQRSDDRRGVGGPTAGGPGSPLTLRPQRLERGPARGEVLRDGRLGWIVSGRSYDLDDSELDIGQDAESNSAASCSRGR